MEQLLDHQQQVTTALAQARRMLATQPPPVEALSTSRLQIFRLLRAYQLFKHIEIFDPMSGHAEEARSRLATDMKERCLAAGQAVEGHVRRWSSHDALNDWELRRRDMERTIAAIEAHLKREAGEAMVLLGGIDRTRRP